MPKTRELARLLSHELPELDFDVPQTGFTNIMPKGWNKGAAALYLRDYLGVAPEDVFVFGDAENDLAMLEAVENSVAVSNATPGCRRGRPLAHRRVRGPRRGRCHRRSLPRRVSVRALG